MGKLENKEDCEFLLLLEQEKRKWTVDKKREQRREYHFLAF